MEIIDNNGLLSKAYEDLIRATAQQNYWFGNFNCLEEFHQKEDVKIVVERKASGLPVMHQETIEKLYSELDNHIYNERKKEIKNLIDSIKNIVVLGEYQPSENNIYLYIDTINEAASHPEDRLITTYIHEMLHAYFDRTGHKQLPYVFEIEEALAEAGMLVFLNQVKDSRLTWVFQNVKNKWPELKDYARGAELYLNWTKGQNGLITTITNYKDFSAKKNPAKKNPVKTIPATTNYINASRQSRDAFEDYLLNIGYSQSTAVDKACVHPVSVRITNAVMAVSNGRTDDLFDIFSNSELNSIKSFVESNYYGGNPKRYIKTLELYQSYLHNSGLLRP